jgi:hypothetical protein
MAELIGDLIDVSDRQGTGSIALWKTACRIFGQWSPMWVGHATLYDVGLVSE